jgi:hypothetical protein
MSLEQVYHIRDEEAKAEAMQARLTTAAQALTLAAGSFFHQALDPK